jgi:5S rRNA maturation endonuclease (ribonuclease M5)
VTTLAGTAFERLRVALEQHGSRVTGTGDRLSAQCPAHDDRGPSLSVTGIEGQTLVYCHAGCGTDDVLAAVGLRTADLFDEPRGVTYPYSDGRTVHRTPAKRFWQAGNTHGSALYRLDRVREAVAAGHTVFCVEGEKDCHALETLGVTATCSAMGAGKAGKADWTPLAGAKVVIVADRDEPGKRHALDVRRILRGLDTTIDVRLAATGKDAADHVAAGHGLDDFVPVDLPDDTGGIVGNPTGEDIETVHGGTVTVHERPIELDEYLADDSDDEYDWLVPGLLERGDRMILTGAEGGGKSTLLRQVGIQLAAGIHPFGGKPFDPLRVLLLDLENSDRQIKRKLRPLRLVAGSAYRGDMYVRSRVEGLDLLTTEDRGYLAEQVDAVQPDVLITGPAYKMAAGDPIEEKTARPVALLLDKIRATYGCAVLLESHSPHASNGGKRPERPFGASLWLRWPEFGLYLDKETGALRHWRGDREDGRAWPAALQRGGTWPWSPVTRPRDLLWAQILEIAIEDPAMSRRDLVKLTGASLGTVNRTIEEHRAEWNQLTEEAG